MSKHIHHIIPKHAGGTDDPSNLVLLTVEEHAQAHKVLFEQYGRWQDFLAWKALSGQIGKDEIRRELSRLTWLGRKHSDETKQKIRKARSKQVITEETRRKMSQTRKGRKITWDTNAHSPEANIKRSEALKGRPKPIIECPHCGKTGGASAMKQWHFDNCRKNIKCT